MLDTGAVWDGYFCDYDRNFSVGPPNQSVADAQARLIEAVDVAATLAAPGTTAAQLLQAMDRSEIAHRATTSGKHVLGNLLREKELGADVDVVQHVELLSRDL